MFQSLQILLFIASIAATFLFHSIFRGFNSKAWNTPPNGTAVLRYGLMGWFLCGLVWGITLLLALAVYFGSNPYKVTFIPPVLFFSACGLLLSFIINGQKITVNSSGITQWLIWRGHNVFLWGDFETVSVHQQARWFLFETRDKRRLRITVDYSGISNFADCCLKFLPVNTKSSSPQAIEAFQYLINKPCPDASDRA